jgi:large subunit ribosomal protein L3
MTTGLIGKKLGMTQVFLDNGVVEPVTVVEAGPCTVTQIKTRAKDGYEAVQLGFGQTGHLNKSEEGHLARSGSSKLPTLHEFRTANVDEFEIGQTCDVSTFNEGDVVDVTGTSKGRGFTGTMKRHNFSGGPKTHGQSDRWRAPGSIGAGTTPGKVLKGKKMSGHHGNARITTQGLIIVKVDVERNLLLVRGAIPGPRRGTVFVNHSKKQARRNA